jgi:hypothetical protein
MEIAMSLRMSSMNLRRIPGRRRGNLTLEHYAPLPNSRAIAALRLKEPDIHYRDL